MMIFDPLTFSCSTGYPVTWIALILPFPGGSFPPIISLSKAQCFHDLILVFLLPLLQIPKMSVETGYIIQITGVNTFTVKTQYELDHNSKAFVFMF